MSRTSAAAGQGREERRGRLSVREWPTTEQPRVRLATLGPQALAPSELISLVLGTGVAGTGQSGSRAAVDVAQALIATFREESAAVLRRLGTASIDELCRIPGIGPAKAAALIATFELGRRAVEEALPERQRVRSAQDVYELMRLRMRDLAHEEFHVLLLNTQNEILRQVPVTKGTLDASLVHPREIYFHAIRSSAASVILIHNHPSGDPTPSAEDRSVTRQLRQAGSQMGIEVLDHVIIGEGRYVSFAEAGLLD